MFTRPPLSLSRLPAAAAALLLSACASTPPPPPVFDASASLDAQVDTFIQTDRATGKRMKSVQTLGITGCNVLFALETAGHASTGGGLFSSAGGTTRAEAKVSQIYYLKGLDDTTMQAMADRLCADAEARLAAAGFAVKPRAQLQQSEHYRLLMASGKAAPFDHAANGGKYRVFARSGDSVHAADYLGTAGGLRQAFAAVGSGSSWQHETRLISEQQIDAVRLDLLVDFASVQSSGQASPMALASTNSAEVSGEARLAINGKLRIVPRADLKCWDRFGKYECGELHDPASMLSALPLSAPGTFYESFEETTTTGDRVTAGVTKALSIFAAVAGAGGGFSTDVSRYTVTVNPAVYGEKVGTGVGQFLDMAALAAKRAAAR